jgi:hypothetical protein
MMRPFALNSRRSISLREVAGFPWSYDPPDPEAPVIYDPG